MMVRKAIAIALIVTLTGCSQYGTIKKVVAANGATATDDSLEAAMWYICNAASVGAIKRRFRTPAEIETYKALCPDVTR